MFFDHRTNKTLPKLVTLLLLMVLNAPSLHAKSKMVTADWKLDLIAGDRYLQSKELKKAETCYRRAVKDVRRSPGRSSDDLVLCLESLANSLYRQDFLEETLKLYKKSLSILKHHNGKKSPKTIETLIVIGGILEGEGEFKKAQKFYSEALEISSIEPGQNSFTYGKCNYLMGRVLAAQGLDKEAEGSYFLALDTTMRQDKLQSSVFLEELITDYIELMRRSENEGKILKSKFQAELLKDDMNSLMKRKGVANSSWTKEIKAELSRGDSSDFQKASPVRSGKVPTGLIADPKNNTKNSVIVPSREISDAVALKNINKQRVLFYERMIELDIKTLGPNHPSVARDLTGLATIYMSQRNYVDAKPLLRRALTIYENTYNQRSQLIKQTKMLLNLISQSQVSSEPIQFVSFEEKLPDVPTEAQKLEVSLRLNSLAFMCYCQGKISTAKQIYYWALSCTSKAAGERSLLAAASMTDLSRLLRLTGRSRDAKQLETNARAIWQRDFLETKAKLLP